MKCKYCKTTIVLIDIRNKDYYWCNTCKILEEVVKNNKKYKYFFQE